MSATTRDAKRYMKHYVYLPVALHPNPRQALLISYGVGSTAKALVETSQLTSIDIVDISKEILAIRLLTMHNLYFFSGLMTSIRDAIKDGTFTELKNKFETAEVI